MVVDKDKLKHIMDDAEKRNPGAKNLKAINSSERARELQKLGVEKRRENKLIREKMKQTLLLFQKLSIDEIPKGIDVLRIAMANAIMNNEIDEAARLGAIIAPYETAKLASQEITVNDNLADKTDAELMAIAKELGLKTEDEAVH